ncbi:MAG: S-layer homology domain-containing protein, partial [bacterium]
MKKLLSSLAILSMLFLNNIAKAQDYTDITPTHWAYNYVKLLSDDGVVVGYPDKTFRPDNNITRAEFATMAIKALKQQNAQIKYAPEFSDVQKDYWAYEMIRKAGYFDLVKGTSDGKFLPEETVSRAQVLSIVINALTTEDMTPDQAKQILSKSYSDY